VNSRFSIVTRSNKAHLIYLSARDAWPAVWPSMTSSDQITVQQLYLRSDIGMAVDNCLPERKHDKDLDFVIGRSIDVSSTVHYPAFTDHLRPMTCLQLLIRFCRFGCTYELSFAVRSGLP